MPSSAGRGGARRGAERGGEKEERVCGGGGKGGRGDEAPYWSPQRTVLVVLGEEAGDELVADVDVELFEGAAELDGGELRGKGGKGGGAW
jgi:hypothetical protein